MNYEAISQNISKFRKQAGLTQEQLAERLGVSAQAVSKWENGQSYPDISLLPQIAKIFTCSIDELFSYRKEGVVRMASDLERKRPEDMFFKVRVKSVAGDKIQVNLPAPIFMIALQSGSMEISGTNVSDSLKHIDFDDLIKLMDMGAMGKLVEVESAEGDTIEVYVE